MKKYRVSMSIPGLSDVLEKVGEVGRTVEIGSDGTIVIELEAEREWDVAFVAMDLEHEILALGYHDSCDIKSCTEVEQVAKKAVKVKKSK